MATPPRVAGAIRALPGSGAPRALCTPCASSLQERIFRRVFLRQGAHPRVLVRGSSCDRSWSPRFPAGPKLPLRFSLGWRAVSHRRYPRSSLMFASAKRLRHRLGLFRELCPSFRIADSRDSEAGLFGHPRRQHCQFAETGSRAHQPHPTILRLLPGVISRLLPIFPRGFGFRRPPHFHFGFRLLFSQRTMWKLSRPNSAVNKKFQ